MGVAKSAENKKVSGGFDYEYFATDHLGNIRAVYGENSSGNLDVRQLADYYPFGEKHDRIYTGITGSDNNYLFNGKELQSYVGGNFNFYDFGARYYDPIIGRWHSIDPVMQFASPYIGIGNNPINMIDPNGMESQVLRWAKERWRNFWDNAYEEIIYPMGKAQASIFKVLPSNILNVIGAIQSIGYDIAFDEEVSGWDIAMVAFAAIGYGLENVEAFNYFGDHTGNEDFLTYITRTKLDDKLPGLEGFANWFEGSGRHIFNPGTAEAAQFIFASLTSLPSEPFQPTQSGGIFPEAPFTGSTADGKIYFEGVRVRDVNMFGFKRGAAATVPGIGIIVGPNDIYNIDLLRHEFGHILQYRKWGARTYYNEIVPASLNSAKKANNDWRYDHMNTWCEWSANYLSYYYFGQPTDWNMREYQIYPTKRRLGVMPPFVIGPFDFKFNWLDN